MQGPSPDVINLCDLIMCTPFQFFSTKSDGLVNRTKQLINQLAFGTGLRYLNAMSLCGMGVI